MPVYVMRVSFQTVPGRRDEAVSYVKQIGQRMEALGLGSSGRIVSAVFASPGAPDIYAEFEVEDLGATEEGFVKLFEDPEFQAINQKFVAFLTDAAKTELYMVEE
ncbi:MAG: hypothetical protein ACE5JP_06505 [Candidatus Bipolaricaulia bacterium]